MRFSVLSGCLRGCEAHCPTGCGRPPHAPTDEELGKLLGGVTVAAGGVLPNIHAVLLPKKSDLKGGKEKPESQSF